MFDAASHWDTCSDGVQGRDEVRTLRERAHQRWTYKVSGEQHQWPSKTTTSQLLAVCLHLRCELASSSSGLFFVCHVQVVNVVEMHDVKEPRLRRVWHRLFTFFFVLITGVGSKARDSSRQLCQFFLWLYEDNEWYSRRGLTIVSRERVITTN